MWEAVLPDPLITFYAHFDLLNKESAVKSTLPLEDPCDMSPSQKTQDSHHRLST